MFCKKGILRNFAKFTGAPGLFLNKVADFFFFFYFLHSVFLLFSLKNKTLHLLISVVFVSCGYGMQPTVFHELPSTRYRECLILYSLCLMSGPCSCSNFIACCITCRMNGTGSFSLMSPVNPAAHCGLISFSVYVILWGICTQAIAMSVFILIAVILPLPHCCLSLWKHFISICLVHSRTWCCKFLHTLQYSVFVFSWRSFFNSLAPSAPSLHFRNTISVLSYMLISYSSSLVIQIVRFPVLFPIYIFISWLIP